MRAMKMRAIWITGAALTLGGVGPAGAAGEPGIRADAPPTTIDDLRLPGEGVAEGVYDVTFNTFESGSEAFSITRDGDEYVVGVIHKPGGGPQSPFAAVARYGPDGGFRGATLRTLNRKGGIDEYNVGDGGLRARRGGDDKTTPTENGWVAAIPTYVDDFALLRRLGDLAVGARINPPYYTFDTDFSWTWGDLPMELVRLEDRVMTRADGSKLTLRQYRQSLEIPGMQEFVRTTLVDERGLPVRITIKMSFGTIEARLRGFDLP